MKTGYLTEIRKKKYKRKGENYTRINITNPFVKIY
jgi:hypothetical protein